MGNYYSLRYLVHSASEDTGGMYMAEIPVLPGCRAWAGTRDETLDILTSVAQEFIASYKAHGEALPDGVLASQNVKESEDSKASDRLLVDA
jgi:predicted RNase H-like HicB family nuclease